MEYDEPAPMRKGSAAREARCPTCRDFYDFLSTGGKVGKHYTPIFKHHDSFLDLRKSAEQDCDICEYIFRLLIIHADSQDDLLQSTSYIEFFLNFPILTLRLKPEVLKVSQVCLEVKPPRLRDAFRSAKTKALTKDALQKNFQDALALARTLFEECLRTDEHRIQYRSEILPRRLVFVGTSQNVRVQRVVATRDIPAILNTSSQPLVYCTLSYCWGTGRSLARLTRETESEYTKNIPWDDMPRTIQDAITITRNLRVHFLWVDALCIIQPVDGVNVDNSDWEEESARMDHIYRNSICTISATGAEGSGDGCWFDRPWRDEVGKSERFRGHRFQGQQTLTLKAPLYFYESVRRSPLHQRGWTLQEQYFSSRNLHWTKDGLIWECETLRTSEEKIDFYEPLLGRWSKLKLAYPTSSAELWSRLVEDYSGRHLTKPSDVLVALSGLAKAFQQTLQDDYLAGLWKSTLPESLLWYSRVEQLGQASISYLAPSWSWASRPSTSIEIDHTESYSKIPGVEILEVDTFVKPATADPTGAIAGGQVRLMVPHITLIPAGDLGAIGDTVRLSRPLNARMELFLHKPLEKRNKGLLCIFITEFMSYYRGLVIEKAKDSHGVYQRSGYVELKLHGTIVNMAKWDKWERVTLI